MNNSWGGVYSLIKMTAFFFIGLESLCSLFLALDCFQLCIPQENFLAKCLIISIVYVHLHHQKKLNKTKQKKPTTDLKCASLQTLYQYSLERSILIQSPLRIILIFYFNFFSEKFVLSYCAVEKRKTNKYHELYKLFA